MHTSEIKILLNLPLACH